MKPSIRNRPLRVTAAALAAALVFTVAEAPAAKIVLRVQAGNPVGADKEQKCQVKINLPEGVRTNNILSLGGLELGYDVQNDQYYVHRELTLAPKEVKVFDVEIEDIWTIPDAELSAMREHAVRMLDMLKEHPQQLATAQDMQATIEANLRRIDELQRANAIGPGVQPLTHIRAHASNLETLKRVKIDVGRVENLVLGTGQDPGAMLGEDRRAPKPERFLESSAAFTNTAVVRIVVENTSPNATRKVPVRHDLPEEIREHDVVDAGGLELATDKERGVAYVFKQNLELAPREKRTFDIRIKDKWNINGPRVTTLTRTADDLLTRVSAAGKFVSIEEALRAIQADLGAVSAEQGPATVDAQYVAFYRTQAVRLDDIETRLNRIVMAIPVIDQSTRFGARIKAPSAKTTWLIIYIILGFLALLSVTFYFRWYGKNRSEKSDGGDPGER